MFIFLAQKSGLPKNEMTFAKILQNNGYKVVLNGMDNVVHFSGVGVQLVIFLLEVKGVLKFGVLCC